MWTSEAVGDRDERLHPERGGESSFGIRQSVIFDGAPRPFDEGRRAQAAPAGAGPGGLPG